LGALIGNYTRYLEEINIREDKLLLYHCLLELGSPKVNVSEHSLSDKMHLKPVIPEKSKL
jgi:hypothetical protein